MFFAHSLDYYVHYTQKSPIIQSPYLPDFDSVFWWFFPPFFASIRKKNLFSKMKWLFKIIIEQCLTKGGNLLDLKNPNFSFCLPSTKCRYEEQTYTTNKMINQRKSNLKNKRYKMMWRSELFVFNCLFVIPIRRGTNEKLGRPLAALRWISA